MEGKVCARLWPRVPACPPGPHEEENKEVYDEEHIAETKPRGAKAKGASKKKLPKGARKGKADAESLQGHVQ